MNGRRGDPLGDAVIVVSATLVATFTVLLVLFP